MTSLANAIRSLYGVFRLALFDPDGHGFLDHTPRGFWRSFQAAFVIAPFYGLMLWVQFTSGKTDLTALRYLALEYSAYALSWLIFPVVMEWLSRTLNRRSKFIAFIVAYNWAMVLQYMLFISVILLGFVGILSPELARFLTAMLFLWTLVYAGFIAKTALAVPVATAAGVVFLDILLGLLVTRLVVA